MLFGLLEGTHGKGRRAYVAEFRHKNLRGFIGCRMGTGDSRVARFRRSRHMASSVTMRRDVRCGTLPWTESGSKAE
jgi:hypothetical protein